MCGRYWVDATVMKGVFSDFPDFDMMMDGKVDGDMDICPSETAPVIGEKNGSLAVLPERWGFPAYDGKLIINARSETVMKKNMFARGIRSGRIAVPAAGFYEWSARKEKNRFWKDGDPLIYLAGLSDSFADGRRFVIITTRANESVRTIHDRMPLLLGRDQVRQWITDDSRTEELLAGIPPQLERRGEHEQLTLF
jgi:putative SOS response-associated peptidase YedK